MSALSLVHGTRNTQTRLLLHFSIKSLTYLSSENGNVSLDVARMLLTNVDVLAKFDVPESVLEVLSRSTVKHVSIFGRRGPLEAAFTMKELREMINLPEASMIPLDQKFLLPTLPLLASKHAFCNSSTKGRKMLPVQQRKPGHSTSSARPSACPATPASPVSQLSLAHTMVDPTTQKAVPTGESSTIATDLVITSLGFHGEPTVQFYDPGLRHLRTLEGRIVDDARKHRAECIRLWVGGDGSEGCARHDDDECVRRGGYDHR